MIFTESVLIVSRTEKSIAFLKEELNMFSCKSVTVAVSCSEARRLILEKDYNLVIINAPLGDESGESLSRHIATNTVSQVILLIKNEFYDAVSEVVEDCGVITVAKPINKNLFWAALKFVKAAGNKIRQVQSENNKLLQKIDDIKAIDRAKCLLVSRKDLNENEAHKYIEKLAMDKRMTRRAVAEEILKTYEN